MKDCKKVKGFKSFFKIDYNNIKLCKNLFNTSHILSVLDKNDNPLKMIAKLEIEDTKNKKQVYNELHIQSYAGFHGISPKIYDFFICNHNSKNYYTFLMEKIEGKTLDYYIKRKEVTQQMKNKIKQSLDKMYDLGIRHDDMHGGNFIISKGKVYIIDFGETKLYKSKVPVEERKYTIQSNEEIHTQLVVGKEHPNIKKIREEKIKRMKKTVKNAKKKGLENEIQNLEKMVKKQKNEKMKNVYKSIIKQKKIQLNNLFI